APRRASRRPVPERLLLRLQSYEAAVQGQPGAAAGSLVGNRPRSADGERHGTRRDAGLELGAARCSQLRGTALSVLDDESRGTRVCGAARVSTVGLRRGQTAHHRNPLQHIRYAPAHRAGHPVDVARRAGSGGNAGKRGVPGVVVEHAGEGGDAGIPFELARRLQRRKYIPPGNAFRCSVEPHRLRQRRIRCTGFQSCHADGPGRTPAVHAGSRKPSARGSSRHTDLLFREQAPGQSARRWLGRQCPGLSLQSAPEPFTRIKITGLRMLRFALLRILSAIPTLFLVVVLAFLMVHAAPGGPFDQERVLPPENARNLAAAYHLDEPLPRQFGRYVSRLVRGDLGPSYYYRDHSVSDLIGAALPKSLQLGLLSMALALLVGISAGTTAALKRDTLLDRFVTGFSMTGISVPVFVIAPLLVLVFAVQLRWLPASWSGSAGFDRLLLPVLALSLPQIAYVTRLVRASMIEVLSSDFIRTARAQGLSTMSIIRYHALKPAMLPVVSYLGPATAAVLTGAVVVEIVFGVPGLGQLFVRGALNRDYTLVLGIVIFYAILIILLNLLVDLLYGFLDPRIREA